MSGQLKAWSTLAAVVMTAALASPGFAQDIRRYGDQQESGSSQGGGGGGSQMVYPGQPMPQNDGNQQQAAQTNQQQAGEEKKDGENSEDGDGMEASYEIRMYEPGSDKEKDDLIKKKKPEEMYRGVIPGTRESVEHLDEARKKAEAGGPNLVTWVGFQSEKKRSRVFVQTAKQPQYDISTEEDGTTVVVTLKDTDFADKNFSRRINATYFERNPKMVQATKDGDDVRVEIRLREAESPDVTAEGNYIRLDFDARVPKDVANNETTPSSGS